MQCQRDSQTSHTEECQHRGDWDTHRVQYHQHQNEPQSDICSTSDIGTEGNEIFGAIQQFIHHVHHNADDQCPDEHHRNNAENSHESSGGPDGAHILTQLSKGTCYINIHSNATSFLLYFPYFTTKLFLFQVV